MPCYDDRDRTDAIEVSRELDRVTAFACMVLSTLELENELGHFAELFDYKEAGVTRKQLFDWWERHKAEDCVRRDQERVERERQEKKAAALAKLTPEERKLLGVK